MILAQGFARAILDKIFATLSHELGNERDHSLRPAAVPKFWAWNSTGDAAVAGVSNPRGIGVWQKCKNRTWCSLGLGKPGRLMINWGIISYKPIYSGEFQVTKQGFEQ
jgi:hypothetical protein